MNNIDKFSIKSQQDDLILYGLTVKAVQPKAIIQISHGMCEHKERYVSFMSYMAKQGYTSFVNDHRGHGESVRSKKDLGYLYENGGEFLVEDLHQITGFIKESYNNLPLIILGHSMGSLGARVYSKKYDDEIDGLIICGSPCNDSGISLVQKIEEILIKIEGEYHKSNIINNAFLYKFNKKFKEEGLNNSWICSDKRVVNKYNKDNLCNFCFTLNGYKALLYLIKETYNKNGWNLNNPKLPIRFLSGEDDPCLVDKKNFLKALDILKEIGYQNISYRIFNNMRHEILNEKNKKTVYKDIINTINSWI